MGTLTAIALIASGCEPASPDQIAQANATIVKRSNQPKQEVSVASVSGSWTGACVLDPNKNKIYRRDVLEISSHYMTSATNFFSDSKCKMKLFTQSLSGFYELNRETMKLTYSNVSILPQAAIIALMFNQKDGFCKATDWVVNQLRIVNDVTSCGFPELTKTKIERYGPNELFLGDQKFLMN